MLNRFVFVYLDDILIFCRTPEDHFRHVRLVLQRLLENRLFVKAEKCEFHTSSISFMGFIVEKGQIKVDPAKIQAVVIWRSHTSKMQRFTILTTLLLSTDSPNRLILFHCPSSPQPLKLLTSSLYMYSDYMASPLTLSRTGDSSLPLKSGGHFAELCVQLPACLLSSPVQWPDGVGKSELGSLPCVM